MKVGIRHLWCEGMASTATQVNRQFCGGCYGQVCTENHLEGGGGGGGVARVDRSGDALLESA